MGTRTPGHSRPGFFWGPGRKILAEILGDVSVPVLGDVSISVLGIVFVPVLGDVSVPILGICLDPSPLKN